MPEVVITASANANGFLIAKGFKMVLAEIKQDGQYHVKRIVGDAKLHAHLEDLGFVPGAPITVVSHSGRNIIVNVKGSRVAVGYDLAQSITV